MSGKKRAKSTTVSKNESKWLAKYAELQEYFKKYGNTSVSATSTVYPSLGHWVNKQRYQYRLMMKNRESAMTVDRAMKLNQLNFIWDHTKKGNTDEWTRNFNDLKMFCRIYGRCEVGDIPKYKCLAIWIDHQRAEYAEIIEHEKKSTFLSLRRIQMLESIGFSWIAPVDGSKITSKVIEVDENRNQTPSQVLTDRWERHFGLLKKYKEERGTAYIKRDENAQLAVWCERQRVDYKLLRAGKPSAMTVDRLKMLNSIGFIFDASMIKGSGQRKEKAWLEMFDQLKEYKRIHGHCNVSQKLKPHIQLGRWVYRQRRDYVTYKNNKPSALTPLRFERLENLGFQWVSTTKLIQQKLDVVEIEGTDSAADRFEETINILDNTEATSSSPTNIPNELIDGSSLSDVIGKDIEIIKI